MRRLALTAAAALVTLAAPGAAAAAPESQPCSTDAPTAVVTTVPFERYAPDTVYLSKSLGLCYVNLDTEFHDVVALGATRPSDSAPWCVHYPPDPDDPTRETCPLFWTPLLPPGGTDPNLVIARRSDAQVQGLEDTEVGKTYTFFCSIHPLMTGTIEVVQ